jgi:hypothetical protein
VGRETLRTGVKILSDIADDDETKPRPHIVASRVTEAINRLRGSGRKRKTKKNKGPIKKKKARLTKRDIFFP